MPKLFSQELETTLIDPNMEHTELILHILHYAAGPQTSSNQRIADRRSLKAAAKVLRKFLQEGKGRTVMEAAKREPDLVAEYDLEPDAWIFWGVDKDWPGKDRKIEITRQCPMQ